MSVADQITRIQQAKTDLRTAIQAKGVTVPSATLIDGYAALVSQIPTGGGSVTELSYPEWLKDGDTHLWLDIVNSYQLAQQLRIRMIGTIDWGDGTVESVSVTTYTTFSHTYASTGKYRIDLHPTSGTFYMGGAASGYCIMGQRATSTYPRIAALYQVEVGSSRITTLSNYVFYYCLGLQRAYVPKTITTVGTYTFAYCYSLVSVTFEDSTTITSTSSNQFAYMDYNLQELPDFAPTGQTSMSNNFYQCWSLPEIIIPAGVTSIGTNTFQYCYGLKLLRCLPTTPPTITALNGIPADCVIQVPSASLAAYQAATGWSDLASQMVGV